MSPRAIDSQLPSDTDSMSQQPEQKETNGQACAIPYRRRAGQLEFCLITSSSGRWGFPKGFIDRGETVRQAALKEAFEEAGLHGRIQGKPLGSYPLERNGTTLPVTVVLMKVTRCDEHWEEEDRRERQWVAAADVASWIAQPGQRDLLALALEQL